MTPEKQFSAKLLELQGDMNLTEFAAHLDMSRPSVLRMLGDKNFGVKTMSRVMFKLGHRVEIRFVPLPKKPAKKKSRNRA